MAHACLTRIGLNASVALLKRGTSVTETAACCGFANLSHFSRMFRSHTGISPKQRALGVTPRLQRQVADIFAALKQKSSKGQIFSVY
ncbi:MAG: helix-turn-helix domain-containing protein, partial [Marinobacter sp.]|uniref:helix-turn-helix domain-containing protein n=1 Tax=Marinobacter sp. TaxID=50741 RepID=UPI003F983E76